MAVTVKYNIVEVHNIDIEEGGLVADVTFERNGVTKRKEVRVLAEMWREIKKQGYCYMTEEEME